MADISANSNAQTDQGWSHGFNLAAIAAILILCGVGLAYVIDGLSRANDTRLAIRPDGPPVSKSIAGTTLDIPANWFRYDDQKTGAFAGRIDLQIIAPLGRRGSLTPIDITLTPKSRVRTSAQLLDNVYLHLFRDTQKDGPIGLIGKPLRNTQGYDNETVWYDPLSIDPFVAKCQAPIAPGQPTECLRTIALDDNVAATYVFAAPVLENWRDFDKVVMARLGRIIEK